ncbi:hypothetical protein ACN9M0_35945 [Streptomyces sp. R-07]|uniref:hypothetical protein n=1 Tax=Streptomyces sp. R-07 TaxID=3404052 RepID=UPI003CFA0F86
MLPRKRTLTLALALPATLATLIGAAPTTSSPAAGTDRHAPPSVPAPPSARR